MKTIKITELNTQQKKDWDQLFNPWLRNDFETCLSTHDFKMDCIDCGNIIIDVELQINKQGKIKEYQKGKTDFDCSNKTETQIKALESCILKYFLEMEYPESLRNISLQARLGKVTRC